MCINKPTIIQFKISRFRKFAQVRPSSPKFAQVRPSSPKFASALSKTAFHSLATSARPFHSTSTHAETVTHLSFVAQIYGLNTNHYPYEYEVTVNCISVIKQKTVQYQINILKIIAKIRWTVKPQLIMFCDYYTDLFNLAYVITML